MIRLGIVLLLSLLVDGRSEMRFVFRTLKNCPGPPLAMTLHDIVITHSDFGLTSHIDGKINVAQYTDVKSFEVNSLDEGKMPLRIVTRVFRDYCAEIQKNHNVYLDVLFKSKEIPRNCNFQQGVYPASVTLNETYEIPGTVNSKSELVYTATAYATNDQPVMCVLGRGMLHITNPI